MYLFCYLIFAIATVYWLFHTGKVYGYDEGHQDGECRGKYLAECQREAELLDRIHKLEIELRQYKKWAAAVHDDGK